MKKTIFTQLISPAETGLRNQIVAIIGGGGKSTLLATLAKELQRLGLTVLLTSTTKFQPPDNIPVVIQSSNPDYRLEAEQLFRKNSVVAIARQFYRDNRMVGVERAAISEMRRLADVILIEADGSRQRGLKTHKEYEPVIPSCTTSTIILASADIVGQPLNEKNVHRCELFSQKWEISMGTILTPEIIARELLSPYSYLKNVPITSGITFFVNKSDRNFTGGKLLTDRLIRHSNHHVFLGSLKHNRLKRMSAIIPSH